MSPTLTGMKGLDSRELAKYHMVQLQWEFDSNGTKAWTLHAAELFIDEDMFPWTHFDLLICVYQCLNSTTYPNIIADRVDPIMFMMYPNIDGYFQQGSECSMPQSLYSAGVVSGTWLRLYLGLGDPHTTHTDMYNYNTRGGTPPRVSVTVHNFFLYNF